MSKSKIVGMMALIVFVMGIFLVGDAVAGERGKILMREVHYSPTLHAIKVPDVEGHAIIAYEGKGIAFFEKWGACLATETGTFDLLKGEGPGQGYSHYTFPDGSTITMKWEGKIGGGGRPQRKEPGLTSRAREGLKAFRVKVHGSPTT